MNIIRYITSVMLIFVALTAGCESGPPKGMPVEAVDGMVRIDISGITPGETKFYRYEPDGGGTSVFMVARTRKGDIKAAFDACVTCYPHRKGYRAEEDCVVCAYCDTKFSLDELGTGKGNCIPVELKFVMEGDDVVIRETDLVAGSRYFP